MRPLSVVNRNRPGNSHSRRSGSLRFPISAMLFPAQRAHGSNPPNPLSPAERVACMALRPCFVSPFPIEKAAFRKQFFLSSLTDLIIPHLFLRRNLTFSGHFSDIRQTCAGRQSFVFPALSVPLFLLFDLPLVAPNLPLASVRHPRYVLQIHPANVVI